MIAPPYFLAGPLTPAPMTLGRSSLPIEYSIPMPDPTKESKITVLTTDSQKGTIISLFWHAGPAQYVVFWPPEPTLATSGVHWQLKQSKGSLSRFLRVRLQLPWLEQLFVWRWHAESDWKHEGKMPRTGVDEASGEAWVPAEKLSDEAKPGSEEDGVESMRRRRVESEGSK